MYKYVCSTLATWSKNSFLSGSNYPAGGNDYIIQTVPKKFTVMSDNLTMNYNKGLTAVKGTHYWRSNVTDRAIKYDIVDDPSGFNQMTKALSLQITPEVASKQMASCRLCCF